MEWVYVPPYLYLLCSYNLDTLFVGNSHLMSAISFNTTIKCLKRIIHRTEIIPTPFLKLLVGH